MNILMLTNTFTPHVGGVAQSIQGFTNEFRRMGHRVMVAAPLFQGSPKDEPDVVRFPALLGFNGSDFSVPMPELGRLVKKLRQFRPQVIHSHHPFLLGGTALRFATARNLPLVFTHHTMYEHYTHYVPGNSQRLRRFVLDLVTGYCNLCDTVIAPSQSVAKVLKERGVAAPIEVIPSGVDTKLFSSGDRTAFRKRYMIPDAAFVVGHVGRLAPEKNLDFLAESAARFLQQTANTYFVVVGSGPCKESMKAKLAARNLLDRVRFVGFLNHSALPDAYHAMDVFAFSSYSETQGLVLAEAMAAGLPVVAVMSTGAKELVKDGVNGRLLRACNPNTFCAALRYFAGLPPDVRKTYSCNAGLMAMQLEMNQTASKTLDLYDNLINSDPRKKKLAGSPWSLACRRIKAEWYLLHNFMRAAEYSIRPRMVWEVEPTEVEQHMLKEEGLAKRTILPEGTQRTRNLLQELRARSLGWAWSIILRLQCASWRKQYEGMTQLEELLRQGQKVMFVFWHGQYVPLFALLRGRSACVFSSHSARGDIIRDICLRFGYHCVQIPDKGRAYSLEMMRHALTHHRNGGVAVDGPLGPYHVVKKGVVKLASELDYVIVPGSVKARRFRILKHRWDRMEIPGLFTSVAFCVGDPIKIPANPTAEQLTHWSNIVKECLEDLDQRAQDMVRPRRR